MLLLGAVAIVGITFGYNFVVEPVVKSFSEITGDIETGYLKLEKSYRLLQRKNIITDEYEKYEDYIDPAGSEEEELASMLKAIESIASTNKIRITNIRPQPTKSRDIYKLFVFELSAEADITQLSKFIFDLQSSANLMRVTRLTLKSSLNKGNLLSASLEITKPSMFSISL